MCNSFWGFQTNKPKRGKNFCLTSSTCYLNLHELIPSANEDAFKALEKVPKWTIFKEQDVIKTQCWVVQHKQWTKVKFRDSKLPYQNHKQHILPPKMAQFCLMSSWNSPNCWLDDWFTDMYVTTGTDVNNK